MYSWKITYYFNNSTQLKGIYHGPEANSEAVARKLLQGDGRTFNGVRSKDDAGMLLVRNDSIDAIDIRMG